MMSEVRWTRKGSEANYTFYVPCGSEVERWRARWSDTWTFLSKKLFNGQNNFR